MKARVGFISLGCPKNRVDTEVMLGLLKREGYLVVNKMDQADIVIVNTCGFVTPAKEEAINTLLEVALLKDKGNVKKIIATGCLVQRYARELQEEIPEIDALVGVSDFVRIAEVVARVQTGERCCLVGELSNRFRESGPRVLSTPPGWVYLKIAEGCDNRCSYCAIPLIRGPFRSRPLSDILEEAQKLAGLGIKELVLVAQDTTMYGQDLEKNLSLALLLQNLSRIEGIEWIRVMYAHPLHVTPEMVEVIGREPGVIPYLDLPIQHADDSVLKRMGRGYSRSYLVSLIEDLRRRLPGLVLRTTVMVGFPGESESSFENLCSFVKETGFDWLGAFMYSEEEGTAAARWEDDVLEEEKQRRWREIMRMQSAITSELNRRRTGKVEQILVEGCTGPGVYWGRGYYQAPEVDGITILKSAKPLQVGQMVNARLVDSKGYDVTAEVVE
ncbi:30S ribosomal protein S12 methylthiotransferase RimO [Syntrophothermus lipocalidus]|uniref:Ribosomal protein uS12 methylthiotransferase RimO n=1 Tax=Syntrophothermus lipocalidus (strain DSM 12680 / TGB-C1) TaxID=643648 RepID=D7CM86_SYNLT|nr:30S ribosomal protein S12 methylthiotransferase RimO [Syntrophothermus lipocalidus]ADI01821.1 MiaB-like tRNA modifying enzyme YliG [Syntrophothermus lipocalidus DSM 12680]